MKRPSRPAVRAALIALAYLAIGSLWILLSDRVAFAIAGEVSRLAAFQTAKGLAYVAATAIALYLVVRGGMRQVQRAAARVRASEQEAARLGRYLRAIIDAAPLAVFDLAADHSIRSLWNPAAERLFGVSRKRALGSVLRLSADENWGFLKTARRLSSGQNTTPLMPVDMRRDDGSTFPAVVAAAPLSGSDEITVVVASDVTALREATAGLRAALEEREVLLREVHHRVKNNLQIISSLLSLERSEAAGNGTQDVISRTLSRVRAISRVHEELYRRGNLARVELHHYLRALCQDAGAGQDGRRRVRSDLRFDEVLAPAEVAIPLGLLLNELLSAAYAALESPEGGGRIAVSLTGHSGMFVVSFQALDSAEQPILLGRSPRDLVSALAAQLRGRLAEDPGGVWRLTIPFD